MDSQANRTLVEQIFAGLARGDSHLLVESMAEDFAWTVTGTTPWSRTYAGRSAVLGELFGALQTRIAGRITTVPDRIIAEGDVVVVEAHGDNITREGRRYDNRYCFVFTLDGGRLKAVTEYFDTELAAQVLGAPQA